MEREYYFAYGSNMDAAQMKKRCPNAKKLGSGRLPFYRFAIDEALLATVIRDNTSYVEGIIWEVSESDIQKLDIYEGVGSGCYRKEYPTVIIKDEVGTFIEPLVYVSNRPECPEPYNIHTMYLKNIINTAFRNRFPREYVNKLVSFTEQKDGKGSIILVQRKVTETCR